MIIMDLTIATSIVRVDKLHVHAKMDLILTQWNGCVGAKEDKDVGEEEAALQKETALAKVVTITNQVDVEGDGEIDLETGGAGQMGVVETEKGHGVALAGLDEFLNDMRILFYIQ